MIAYSIGIVAMSVCVTNKSTKEEIEDWANKENPTGISSKWTISTEDFQSGEPNPCPCNRHPKTRKHYLLTC